MADGVRAHARFAPPEPDRALLAQVAAGKVGRSTEGPSGVVAWGVIPAPRELVWLTMTDDHLSDAVQALTEVRLRGSWTSPKLIYQRLDLPWPFADRHWVLAVANNGALAEATGVWERAWTQDDSALPGVRSRTDPALFDAAATLPVNRGSWLLVPVDATRTLAVYQVWTELGGSIPTAAVTAWTRASLDGLYADLSAHTEAVRARYGPGCEVQRGADGAPIACLP